MIFRIRFDERNGFRLNPLIIRSYPTQSHTKRQLCVLCVSEFPLREGDPPNYRRRDEEERELLPIED